MDDPKNPVLNPTDPAAAGQAPSPADPSTPTPLVPDAPPAPPPDAPLPPMPEPPMPPAPETGPPTPPAGPAPPGGEDETPPTDVPTPEDQPSEGGLPPVISPPTTGPKAKLIASIIGLVLLVVSIPAGIILVGRQQEIREKAEGNIRVPGACNAADSLVNNNCEPHSTCVRGKCLWNSGQAAGKGCCENAALNCSSGQTCTGPDNNCATGKTCATPSGQAPTPTPTPGTSQPGKCGDASVGGNYCTIDHSSDPAAYCEGKGTFVKAEEKGSSDCSSGGNKCYKVTCATQQSQVPQCSESFDPGNAPTGYYWDTDCNASCPNGNSDCGEYAPGKQNWCYGFSGGSKCIRLKATGSTVPTCKDNPEGAPAGYKWKADCLGQTCSDKSECPMGVTNQPDSRWCYGFTGGAKCLKLELASTGGGGQCRVDDIKVYDLAKNEYVEAANRNGRFKTGDRVRFVLSTSGDPRKINFCENGVCTELTGNDAGLRNMPTQAEGQKIYRDITLGNVGSVAIRAQCTF